LKGRTNHGRLPEAARLSEINRFYDLMHTFATLILGQREDPKLVQEILDHTRIAHTMDPYSHVTLNMLRVAFGRPARCCSSGRLEDAVGAASISRGDRRSLF